MLTSSLMIIFLHKNAIKYYLYSYLFFKGRSEQRLEEVN